jgi:adenylate cyclase
MSSNNQRLLRDLISSIASWWGAGALYVGIRFFGTKDQMEWSQNPTGLVLLCIFGSTLYGLLFFLTQWLADRPRFRRGSYLALIVTKALVLLACTVVMVLLTRIYASGLGQISPSDIVPSFLRRLTSGAAVVFLIYVFVVAIILNFIRQMQFMIGPEVFWNILFGRYRHPQQEMRLFMFLDLRGSTTHAERLGHIRFSQLLQDCFVDLTDAVIKHKVAIYQYVGDEAVLSWKLEEGQEQAHCLHAYFDFMATLKARSDYYYGRYGMNPEFKAGINLGPVTVTEVGIVKRDIAFHGEAVITAARIQGKCNELQQNLLVSAAVKDLMGTRSDLQYVPLGEVDLRGKTEKIPIFGVHLNVPTK